LARHSFRPLDGRAADADRGRDEGDVDVHSLLLLLSKGELLRCSPIFGLTATCGTEIKLMCQPLRDIAQSAQPEPL
jgi:hypothetical protein